MGAEGIPEMEPALGGSTKGVQGKREGGGAWRPPNCGPAEGGAPYVGGCIMGWGRGAHSPRFSRGRRRCSSRRHHTFHGSQTPFIRGRMHQRSFAVIEVSSYWVHCLCEPL